MRRILSRATLLVACALVAGGCDTFGNLLFGEAYRGPRPAAEGLNGELAIVRRIDVTPRSIVLLLDRQRYVDASDPHNVNRVVNASTANAGPEAVAALNLTRGDRIVVSTEYAGTVNTIGSMSIPDWPGHNAYEYPIGFHYLTAITRAGN